MYALGHEPGRGQEQAGGGLDPYPDNADAGGPLSRLDFWSIKFGILVFRRCEHQEQSMIETTRLDQIKEVFAEFVRLAENQITCRVSC